jgi:hypothetical protein
MIFIMIKPLKTNFTTKATVGSGIRAVVFSEPVNCRLSVSFFADRQLPPRPYFIPVRVEAIASNSYGKLSTGFFHTSVKYFCVCIIVTVCTGDNRSSKPTLSHLLKHKKGQYAQT